MRRRRKKRPARKANDDGQHYAWLVETHPEAAKVALGEEGFEKLSAATRLLRAVETVQASFARLGEAVASL